MEILKAEQAAYSYKTRYQTIEAVKEVSCSFETGRLYAITGESGSGKSTFLSLLAGLDVPDRGRILVEGIDMKKLNRDHYRRDTASVIYQSFNLFPFLTALENVMYPLELKGMRRREAKKKAEHYIQKAGLPDKVWRQFPQMMSGGEQQRVAIARGLAAGGKILLADEPTGNLDTENEQNIVKLLKEAAHELGYCVIVITHNSRVAEQADLVLHMCDGRLTNEERSMECL